MSLIDDQSAEIDAQLFLARQKSRYGKRYSLAYELALEIKTLREFLSGRRHSAADRLFLLWAKIDNVWSDILERRATDLEPKQAYEIYIALRTAWELLTAAVSMNKNLRKIADALDAAPADDPRQANILKAYADCIEGRYPPTVAEKTDRFVKCYLPTLAQLRDAFVKRFGKECWPRDFAVRKTLKVLGLELSKAKLGRPRGSGSKIGNPRRLEQ
jgi:hypothetical protein